MTIFIGGAWPYANGSLHVGHISSLLPGDILARYYRAKGEQVLYVSGSDCNGTPISLRAKHEEVEVFEIANRYHEEFLTCFEKLGFSYDLYTRTDSEIHHEVVHDIFLRLYEDGHIYKKTIEQCYCESCEQFLPDRYVEGKCPHCLGEARGDQCEHCSTLLDPIDLVSKTCKICNKSPVIRSTEHFYFKLSTFQKQLSEYVENAKQLSEWRENAVALSERYVSEGLKDRAASRDLPIGVPVPIEGYEEKKIYVWIEAVSGYYSASVEWALNHNRNVDDFWNQEVKSYYVHGKDNIPFHTIIWPAILLGTGKAPLPRHIISNEYVTIEKKKISTSRNFAVWIPDLLEYYHPDSIRYFLTSNAPEQRDTDFSFREFILSHNGELLGAYGNFVNRTLKFIEKYYDLHVPKGTVNAQIKERYVFIYDAAGKLIESGQLKKALELIFEEVRAANKYYDSEAPWKTRISNVTSCNDTMVTCLFLIENLATLLHPFLPKSSIDVFRMLGIRSGEWRVQNSTLECIYDVLPLFQRIDLQRIEKEIAKLHDK